MPLRMPLINAYFYEPGNGDKWLNHVVTRYDPPFSHIDLQFEDGMASSVFQYENVYWKQRRFRNPNYRRVTVSVDQGPYKKAYNLCAERAKQGFAFDAVGMYSLPIVSVFSLERDKKTFCSKHCTEVLQLAGLRSVAEAIPAHMTPSAVYRLLATSAVIHADTLSGLRIEAPAK